MTKNKKNLPIVSASKLVSESNAELSEVEYGLIIANNAFSRWTEHCMSASGSEGLSSDGLSTTDILVLHNINHRDRAKRVTDICFTLNIDDTHLVAYALRKLTKRNLVKGDKQGKEVFYTLSEEGAKLCERYREIREHCLIKAFETMGVDHGELSELARTLRSLSGLYDQAARAATSF
ncbi:MAG: winged helix DNA-binding protein [Cocleimonas sp.]